MGDVLVMKQNLFGAGGIHHFATDRTPVVEGLYRFMNLMVRSNFRNCTAWRLADGHAANGHQQSPKRNQATSKWLYKENSYSLTAG